jgi:HAD superfamily phosphoserine phosphatase-like hydrolase
LSSIRRRHDRNPHAVNVQRSGEELLSEEASRILQMVSHTGGTNIALFDFDGTLIDGDLGESVYVALLRRGLQLKLSWEEYQSRHRSNRAKAYADVVRAMSGVSLADVLDATETIIEGKEPAMEANGILIPQPRPRAIMQNLVATLQAAGVKCYVISASNSFSIKLASEKWFHILPEQVFGVTPVVRNGTITGRLCFPAPIGEGKAALYRKKISTHAPLLIAGDSLLDFPMMSLIDPVGTCLWMGKDSLTVVRESLPGCRVISPLSTPDS